jgi:hypothetical protein
MSVSFECRPPGAGPGSGPGVCRSMSISNSMSPLMSPSKHRSMSIISMTSFGSNDTMKPGLLQFHDPIIKAAKQGTWEEVLLLIQMCP